MITVNIYNQDSLGKPMTVVLPENWQELTPEQYMHTAYALYTMQEADERHSYVLLQLLGKAALKIPAEVLVAQIFPLLEWMYEPPKSVTQLIPEVKHLFLHYYGPESNFGNLTLGEFDVAERELHLWLEDTTNDEHLWRFMAVLYRPGKNGYNKAKDPDGDIREVFNSNKTGYYAKQLKQHVFAGAAYAAVLWYKTCHLALTIMYKRVFEKPLIITGHVDNEPEELPNCYNIMRKIAEKGTYGNYDQVEKMYLHIALLEIEHSMKESDAKID